MEKDALVDVKEGGKLLAYDGWRAFSCKLV